MIVGLAGVLLLGCEERDRLTFSNNQPDDGVGPTVIIDSPFQDTVLTEGDFFILAGRAIDSSGVDTVYFDLEGANQSFLPLRGEGADTVPFGLPLSTIGNSGRTIRVTVFAVDLPGNVGPAVLRRLSIE